MPRVQPQPLLHETPPPLIQGEYRRSVIDSIETARICTSRVHELLDELRDEVLPAVRRSHILAVYTAARYAAHCGRTALRAVDIVVLSAWDEAVAEWREVERRDLTGSRVDRELVANYLHAAARLNDVLDAPASTAYPTGWIATRVSDQQLREAGAR